jgi:hypothetical protein
MKGTVRRIVSAALVALASVPAAAGPNDAAIREIVDRAVAQWSVFLSCSVLDPEVHGLILRSWDLRRGELDAVLARADLAPETAAAIAAAVDPVALMVPTLGDVATLVAFCHATPDWYRNVTSGRDVIRADREIEALLAR